MTPPAISVFQFVCVWMIDLCDVSFAYSCKDGCEAVYIDSWSWPYLSHCGFLHFLSTEEQLLEQLIVLVCFLPTLLTTPTVPPFLVLFHPSQSPLSNHHPCFSTSHLCSSHCLPLSMHPPSCSPSRSRSPQQIDSRRVRARSWSLWWCVFCCCFCWWLDSSSSIRKASWAAEKRTRRMCK